MGTCALMDICSGCQPLRAGWSGDVLGATSRCAIAVCLPVVAVPCRADDSLLLKIERWYLNQLENITTKNRPGA